MVILECRMTYKMSQCFDFPTNVQYLKPKTLDLWVLDFMNRAVSDRFVLAGIMAVYLQFYTYCFGSWF